MLYSTQHTVYSTQHTVHSIQYTVHSTQYTVHSIQYTVHSTQYTVYSTQCTVHSIQYTVYSIQHTVYSIQYTVYSTQCTVNSIQYTAYSIQHTVTYTVQVCTSHQTLPQKSVSHQNSPSKGDLLTGSTTLPTKPVRPGGFINWVNPPKKLDSITAGAWNCPSYKHPPKKAGFNNAGGLITEGEA